MAVFIKLVLGALLDWVVKQTPTFIAWWEKQQAMKAAEAQLKTDEAAIDAAVKAAQTPPPPKP